MGGVAGVLPGIAKALSCQDCARYVCNSMGIHSRCGDCCEFEFETNEVAIREDNSEYSIEVEGCCEARHK